MTVPRRTLADRAEISGRALFTEQPRVCTLVPAGPGNGLTLRRVDLDAPPVPAHIDTLCLTPVHEAFAHVPPRHTALGPPEAPIYTTEHVLAALVGMGITDAVVEIDGSEIPILDGSARPFTRAIQRAGTRALEGEQGVVRPRERIEIASADGRSSIVIDPLEAEEKPLFRYELDYGPDAPLPPGVAEWRGAPDEFVSEIAPARTFSLHAEATQMLSLGLFGSFTPRDLLVIDERGDPIDNAWRTPDEPARHKVIDLIGDLALAGKPVHARVISRGGGHALNHRAARALADLV